jgi:hypothetical protein
MPGAQGRQGRPVEYHGRALRALCTAPERTRWVAEERMRSGNTVDDHSWTGA